MNHGETVDGNVIKITKNRETTASIDRVWDIISNMDNEKIYWTAIEYVRVLRMDRNRIEREATIMRGPMGNVKSLQTLVLDPKKSITLNMTSGPLIGTRTMVLNLSGEDGTRVDVKWEFELLGVPGFASSFVKDNISRITESALDRIVEDAERQALLKSRS